MTCTFILTSELLSQWEHARAKISQAEQEARHVEYKMREAADLARRSNEARSEAEQAMQLEQETRATAKDLPGRTRAYLYDTRCAPQHSLIQSNTVQHNPHAPMIVIAGLQANARYLLGNTVQNTIHTVQYNP